MKKWEDLHENVREDWQAKWEREAGEERLEEREVRIEEVEEKLKVIDERIQKEEGLMKKNWAYKQVRKMVKIICLKRISIIFDLKNILFWR